MAVTQDQSGLNPDNEHDNVTLKDRGLWRDLLAYWILGLCNNYGYVVMLSAAYDIIARFGKKESLTESEPSHDTGRMCNIISTGAILLADVIPSLTIKIIVPFLPFYIHVRTFLAIALQFAGFILVAYAEFEWMALLGIVLTSLSSGLGEASFLAYTSHFNKNVVSTWSSGTGGSGVIGALSYAGLIALGISPVDTMLIMLSVPILEGIAFWIILRRPLKNPTNTQDGGIDNMQYQQSTENLQSTSTIKMSYREDIEKIDQSNESEERFGLKDRILYLPHLLKYMVPITLVYFLEYFINQGLFELVYFPNIWLDKKSQYRWLQVDYQIGVFISRSSVNLVTIEKVWLMAVFQLLNVIIFLFEVIYFFMPSIWIIFAVVFWEGLLGGSAYVNTFYRMSKDVPPGRREFALGVVPIGDAIGIAVAGAVAIPVHNALCQLPIPR
ncbi:Battenin [Pseudolycoriella hygida]|uniref:Battenin n=1 Tax=Pseudolycoriella hygida TaxID=35572 RepID=A0A9Q0NAF6_9DIPT|nr:Battenin [Pseudolycoriella hygida]